MNGETAEKERFVINASYHTALRCSECGITPEAMAAAGRAVQYYIKRRRGLYALLCFQNGQGCWERSSRTPCRHVDAQGNWQCPNLAEYEITWGKGDAKTESCSACLNQMIPADVDELKIYPLED